ncbi:XRE family transcriptional regulator [Conexibacter sp. JD483]|uniref:XRE family transcriptional regulator n=1 Tax=unclassified Conexibacter TaxID=2627773 RepID=UPI0027280DB8|nr:MULTISPECIES: XRE family transcriptional regulator [unclassified Conexibacter]MDO8187293.1 XRE family transcriptional regulator [Conexibacter sp. CPCC 205706]MDO8198902.1 XRE family transcriptional regulator [Conexibacter sp. CPCC 205762]MDR9370641.1 XRE family transcriptional regulator [Conexibacter sp. JD483]
MATRALTTPNVLRWAREAAGYAPSSAARKVGVREDILLAAERGDHFLTLRQAELAAAAYGRSLALLMSPEPPAELSVDAKYRRLRGAPRPPWSPELIKLEREIRDQQDTTVDLWAALGESPPWHEAMRRLQLPRLPEATYLAHILGLEPYALRSSDPRNIWHSRRAVVRAAEWAGVLVIRCPVPDSGVRGFVLPHADVPAIYVNSAEDPRAQAFTVMHEFAHLLLDVADERRDDEERWCDEYAGTVLMPEPEFAESFGVGQGRSIESIAQDFGVTPGAAATRAAQLGLLGWSQARDILGRSFSGPTAKGGNGNQRKVARLSPTFTDLVLAAADSSAVTLATASRLLRTKVEDFAKLRAFADRELLDR